MRVRVVGVGMGPQHVTPEAAQALRSCDYAVAAEKSGDDPLLALRRQICAEHGLELVAVPDPERDRDDPGDYEAAVRDWHAARVTAYAEVLRTRGGVAAFLVWGDPSLYDSTIRVAEALAEQVPLEYDVVPGVCAPALLAARHRVVLHPVGRPVHVTTARRLAEDVESGQTNLVVMLGDAAALGTLAGLTGWQLWWGANLGTDSEELVAGRLPDVLDEVRAGRERARERAGWVMDTYLLRSPA